VVALQPPTGLPAQGFDLVYGISVLSHLSEPDQFAWLAELARLTRPGALLLLSTLGADVSLVGPPTLLPVGVESWPVEVGYDLDQALAKCDAVMMLRVQKERMNASYFPSAREYARRYGLDARRMALLPEHAVVLHPGPMNRGMEITADVADAARSLIVEQVTNGVAIRMAVLYLLLSGTPLPSPDTDLEGSR